MAQIDIRKDVLSRNQDWAQANRSRFEGSGVLAINMVSSPGSGKTTLIEKMSVRLKDRLNLFVIEGDLETERDAQRLRDLGVAAIQIETRGACHLDAATIHEKIVALDLDKIDLLVIENVGNLVCPSGFDLGERLRVVVASTTEGEDKPFKYPQAYRRAHVCLLNKIDLLPYLSFSVEEFELGARQARPELRLFHTSCTTGRGLDKWCDWLVEFARNAALK